MVELGVAVGTGIETGTSGVVTAADVEVEADALEEDDEFEDGPTLSDLPLSELPEGVVTSVYVSELELATQVERESASEAVVDDDDGYQSTPCIPTSAERAVWWW